jgi:ribosome-interacting GTPase 1
MKKTGSGGIRIYSPKSISVREEEIKEILKEFKITNCDLYIRENVDVDDIIDFLRGNTMHVPAVIAINKSDLPHDRQQIVPSLPPKLEYIFVSASTGDGVEDLKNLIFHGLKLVRIYLREKSGEVDYVRPLILRGKVSVRDVCRRISMEMLSSFKYAIILNSKRKQSEIRAGLDFELRDEDIVTLISRN